ASAKSAKAVEDRFKDMPKLDAATIPVSGEENRALAPVDAAIRKFMAEKGIGALTFAISKGGKILYDRAFGWSDADLKEPLQPGVKMRVASMTKPVVSATIRTFIAEGKLKMDDKVFTVLELDKFKEAKGCDKRWKDITIQQLLEHKGGWDRDKSGDTVVRTRDIMNLFNIKEEEVTPLHAVKYGLTLPLDFDPGERSAYSNYGYTVLARVIEKLSGKPMVEHWQDSVAKKSGSSSFSLSTSDVTNRQPGEIWYSYNPDYGQKRVPLPLRIEAQDGAGALATTAADYCRFLEHYWISGEPRNGDGYAYSFNGSLPGTTAICSQRLDGISYTAIANRRGAPKSDWNGSLRAAIDKALAKVADKVPRG
ncbi:MAG TPA: serine hydrolase domain-containing protein, partial [Verrucomicrobium sp.]|nr:serine hydrolase domain-containing protein [Verrucomicrobium sp.]